MDIFSYSQDWSDEQKMEWFKDTFRSHFETWVVSPAQDMMIHHNGRMPAFVWITCAIEWIAGFWWGKPTKGQTKECYIRFINEYFPKDKYDADGLWGSLRNGLVHMYTIKHAKYALKDGHKEAHLQQAKRYVVLNLENFFEDFVSAKDKYFNAVENNPALFRKFLERYERDGFLGLVPLVP